jgi:hypothetical protein
VHEQTGRLFLCARCQAQVLVCRQCDRGQRYCNSGCADLTRLSLQREASQRYQQSRPGRHKHAARMHQWRKRRAASAKIVTHHSSQVPPGDAVLAGNESPPAISPDSHRPAPCSPLALQSPALSATASTTATTCTSVAAPVWRCHWCQSPCAALVRQGFVRHSRAVRNGRHP